VTPAGLIPTGLGCDPLSPGERLPTPSGASRVAALATGAVLTAATDRALAAVTRKAGRAPAGWTRSNYRGRPVTLSGGVAAAIGAGVTASAFAPRGLRAPVALVAAAAGLAGAYDDLVAPRVELSGDKGWRGHVQALRSGRPSGGVVKVAVVGAAAVGAGRLATGSWSSTWPAAALIAGTANLVNLFDLRPGRAGKVVTVLAATQLSGPLAGPTAAVLGAALAELPGDLGETRMLGDVGANPLGAVLGLRLAANPTPARWAALALVTGLTVASERVSFTQVIAGHRSLRAVDEWGRLPADARPAL
jgi:hypothetical protein